MLNSHCGVSFCTVGTHGLHSHIQQATAASRALIQRRIKAKKEEISAKGFVSERYEHCTHTICNFDFFQGWLTDDTNFYTNVVSCNQSAAGFQ